MKIKKEDIEADYQEAQKELTAVELELRRLTDQQTALRTQIKGLKLLLGNSLVVLDSKPGDYSFADSVKHLVMVSGAEGVTFKTLREMLKTWGYETRNNTLSSTLHRLNGKVLVKTGDRYFLK